MKITPHLKKEFIEDVSSIYAISYMATYIKFLNTKAWGLSTNGNIVFEDP